ncbi:hypothetical protein K523DRAFT_301671 [Schizophyllum commune Tattone D]|nr:hypothetical protein K523DRAFT_301671 [Schizophyllum commune Tattone D]
MIDTFRADESRLRLSARLNQIFCEGQHTLLHNVSGSGKTSLLLEGLRHRWGLYFVGVVDSWSIGSRDICTALEILADERSAGILRSQGSRMEILRIPLLVRLLAFEAFAQTVNVSHASAEDREMWLLAQACCRDYLDGGDEYALFTSAIYYKESLNISAEIEKAITRIRVLTGDPDFHFYCVVDEAQVLAHDVRSRGGDGSPTISPHRDLSQSWDSYSWLTIIMSGTVVPHQHYRTTDYRIVSTTGSFDRQQAASYIQRFLPPHYLSTAAEQALTERGGAWLRGRHRFSGAFVVLVLSCGLRAPHSLFDDFIWTMTGFRPFDAGELVSEEATSTGVARRYFAPLRTLHASSHATVRRALHHVVFKYLTTGACTHIFNTDYVALVENAAGRFCDDDASQIVVDEPLCIVSAANWLCGSTSEGVLNLDLVQNVGDPSISSIREYVSLLLANSLSDPRPLSDLMDHTGLARPWTSGTVELVELHRSLDGASSVFYPFRYQHLSSARPITLATDCTTYADVLAWLTHERTSPFCLLPDGRSLLFALRLSDGSSCWALAQTVWKVSDVLSQCFHPSNDDEKDASHATALLSQIPVPCKTLGSPPILRITISPTTDAVASEGPIMDKAMLESLAAAINLQDVLHRIVANVVRIAEPHAPAARELVSPGAPLSPPTMPERKTVRPRRSREKASKTNEQTRYNLRPRQKDIPTGPITRSMQAKAATERRCKSLVRLGKRSYADNDGVGSQKRIKRPRTIA